MSRMRTCPVEGCAAEHPRTHLMCQLHWWAVPKPLRDELWRAYRGRGVLSVEYSDARERCIAVAEGREPDLEQP